MSRNSNSNPNAGGSLSSYLLDDVDVEIAPDAPRTQLAPLNNSSAASASRPRPRTKKPYPAWFMPIRLNMFRVWLFTVL